jgi:hypothetical protein
VLAALVVPVTARLYGPRFHSCDVLVSRARADLDAASFERFRAIALPPLESGHEWRARPRHLVVEVFVHYALGWDQVRDHESCTNLLRPAVYGKVLDNVRSISGSSTEAR